MFGIIECALYEHAHAHWFEYRSIILPDNVRDSYRHEMRIQQHYNKHNICAWLYLASRASGLVACCLYLHLIAAPIKSCDDESDLAAGEEGRIAALDTQTFPPNLEVMKSFVLLFALLAACAAAHSRAGGLIKSNGPKCAATTCPKHHTCFETESRAFCVKEGGSGSAGDRPHPVAVESEPSPLPVSPEPTAQSAANCSTLVCPDDYFCIETPGGPQCTPDVGCAATTCVVGSQCVVTPTGPECQPVQPEPDGCACILVFDPVCCQFPNGVVETAGNECECSGCGSGKVISRGSCPDPVTVTAEPQPPAPSDCSSLECPDGDLCIETPEGPQCTPDVGCAATICAAGSECVVTPTGPQCQPVPPKPDSCACALLFDPVCCKFTDGVVKTVGNECQCSGCGSGNQVLFKRSCPPVSCALLHCAPGFSCIQDGDAARCVPRQPVACSCAQIFEPVCCLSSDGLDTRSNPCDCTCISSGVVVRHGTCPHYW